MRPLYFEEHERVEEVHLREKQIQGWSRAKREALIAANYEGLPTFSHNSDQPDTRRHQPSP